MAYCENGENTYGCVSRMKYVLQFSFDVNILEQLQCKFLMKTESKINNI